MEYVYLLQEREFVKSNEPIFKIGRTKQLNFARFRQYPKNSISYFQSYCDDCVLCESKIISVFSIKYKRRIDVGQEYFEGNVFDMIIQISIIVQNNLQEKKNKMYHEKNSMKLKKEMYGEFFNNQKQPPKKIKYDIEPIMEPTIAKPTITEPTITEPEKKSESESESESKKDNIPKVRQNIFTFIILQVRLLIISICNIKFE